MTTNITDLLFEKARKYPEKVAIIHANRSRTFGMLAEKVQVKSQRLTELGIVKGDRILVFVPMSIPLYECLLSVFCIGAVAVFVDAWADSRRLDYAVELSKCKAFIGSPKSFLLMLKSAAIRKVPVKLLPSFGRRGRGDPFAKVTACDVDDPALITFTTGSTGIPKAALRTHAFLLAQHRVLCEEMEMSPNDVDMATLPIFVLNNLACGATTLIPDFNPRKPGDVNGGRILKEVIKYGVTSTAGSPAFYEAFATAASTNTSTMPLQRLYVGGAAVFPDFARRLRSAFPKVRIRVLYGSTEAEPISMVDIDELAALNMKIDESGIPAGRVSQYIDLAIIPLGRHLSRVYSIDEWDALKCPPGVPGEICVAGDHVLTKYYCSPDDIKANKITVGSRVFHRTGDAGRLTEKGSLYLLGRVERLFRRIDGEYCYPLLIEAALRGVRDVSSGTIILLERRGVVLVLETRVSKEKDRQALVDSIRRQGIDFDEVVFRRNLPRDPRHHAKLDYAAIVSVIEKMSVGLS